MIPVDQTVTRSPLDPDGAPGNCFAACLASLLELPLDFVPQPTIEDRHADGWTQPGGYWERIAHFLHGRGFHMVGVDRDRGPRETSSACYLPDNDSLWLASGLSPRGNFLHTVIYRGNELVHDPHPSRAGLDGGVVKADYLVPVDPCRGAA